MSCAIVRASDAHVLCLPFACTLPGLRFSEPLTVKVPDSHEPG
jgi:hypothetical protein